MQRTTILALIVLGLVVLALVAWAFPKLAQAWARDRALSRCDELQRARAAAAVQGGDAVLLARLDSEIRACTQSASSLGADIDLGQATLTGCLAKGEQINQEWAHYRSTNYDDSVKRNNTRNTILRLGEEMARCYQGAIEDAEKPATLDQIRSSIAKAIGESEARETCFLTDGSGCGRFALSEPHGNDKGRDERLRIIEPLRAAHAAATAKFDALRASEAAANAASKFNPALLNAGGGLSRFLA